MNIVRWILFIPAAFLAAVLTGAIFNIIGQFIFGSGKIISAVVWFASGTISSIAWMLAGIKAAPVQNKTSKWILLSLLFLACIISVFGAIIGITDESLPDSKFITDLNPRWGRLLLGVGMAITSLFFIPQKAEEIGEK